MRVIVVGLGSMGRRRLRLLKKIDESLEIVGIDSNIERCKKAEQEFKIKTYAKLEDIEDIEKYDCAVISTSPLSHASIINKCLKKNLHIFTELNLINDMYEENINLAKQKNKVLFLSSTFLYREEIKKINAKVKSSKSKINYIYHVGQYLPDWHPWESIQNYFVGHKKTNGCRELFAIELPWMIEVFGEIESYQVLKSKNTNLDIDYMDNYLLLIMHKNGTKGIFALDVVSRKPVRNLEVFGEDIYITWNGTPESLKEYEVDSKEYKQVKVKGEAEHLENYAAFVIEDAYENELKTFFEIIERKTEPIYTFEKDMKILELIDGIEK